MKNRIAIASLIIGIIGLGIFSAYALEIPYDRYVPLRAEEKIPEKPFLSHLLVYPFEILRGPLDKILVYLESHHVYDKTDYIYEQVKNHGLSLRARALFGGENPGGGFNLDFIRLTNLQEVLPNTTVRGSAFWTFDHISDYELKIKQEKIGGTGLFLGEKSEYENRGEEHFYGIGPETSLGDGTSYRMERTTLAFPIGYELSDTIKIHGNFDYKNVNITNGEDGGRGEIDQIFVATGRQRIPGLGGDQILSWGLGAEHDNRDDQELPTQGGYESLNVSFNKGLESSSGYFKYRAEATHFFKLRSDRRILALRGVVEHNAEVGHRDVPFFDMARMGGYGTYPRLADVNRGLSRSRFYDKNLVLMNAEYRWPVWEYREWRMDSSLFVDNGQVFRGLSKFQFKDFQISYGMGFRLSFQGEVLLSVEAARSHEGSQFYVETRTPF